MITQEKEEEWFDALVKDRGDNARVLAKDSMAGYRQSPIDKYSDQAHFVYEFLQNADDTKSTRCVFALNSGDLVFRHNGKIPFSVSDPRKEAEDRKYGRLGSVNAITAAGLSTKSGNDIGRFGIGFKAVFQYTDEPKIYDDGIRFGLRDEIVPFLLENDFESRKRGETCFYIPFRDAEKVRTHKEISEKIASLTYPLLFLSNLKEIEFKSSGMGGRYSKEVCYTKVYDDIGLEFVILKKEIGRERTETKVLKFSREIEGGRISVVFGVDGNDGNVRLVPLKAPAFCFFPTKKDTELNFLIHAPFLLNDSREGIKVGQPHNEKLIAGLSVLAVKAIDLMVTKLPFETHNWFGRKESEIRLVNDDILNFIPLDLKNNPGEVSFLPFAKVFKTAFATSALIPCQEGWARVLCYQKKDNVCWSPDRELIQLLTSNQITCLLGRQQYWGFATIYNPSNEQKDFIRACCGDILEWSLIRQKLTGAFFEQQPIDWFRRFFDYIVHKPWPWNVDVCKTLPMFLDNDNKAVAAFDEEGNHILYLPAETASTSRTINPRLLQFASVKKIVEQWKIVKESSLSIVKRIIREDLVNDSACMYEQGFTKVLIFCESCSNEDLQKVGDVFIKYPALMAYNPSEERKWKAKSVDCYFINDDLLFYFKGINDIPFVDRAYLDNIAGDEYRAALKKLLSVLEIRSTPKCITELQSRDKVRLIYGETRNWTTSYYLKAYGKIEKWEDVYLDYSKEFLERFMAETEVNARKKMSGIFWKFLCKMIEEIVPANEHIIDEMVGVHHYFQYGWKTETFTPYLCEVLRDTTWLFDECGELRPHAELFVETLSKEYDVDSREAKQLLELLGIEHDDRLRAIETLSEEERSDLHVAKEIRSEGFGSLAEAKIILETIPEEIRHKISEGKLTAAEMLKAVSLLEHSLENSASVVQGSASMPLLKKDSAGDARLAEAPKMAEDRGEQMVEIWGDTKRKKHMAGDYEMEDDEYSEIMKLFEDGLTGEESDDKREKWRDESKLACLRLFNYLEKKGLEPRMDGHRDAKYIVNKLYSDIGKTGPNIDVNSGKKIHVISARGGVAYLPPNWWRKVLYDKESQFEICAVKGALAEDFRFIRNRGELLSIISDNAIPVKVRGRDAIERATLVDTLFSNVNSEESATKIYAMLKVGDNTRMNAAFERGYYNDEMSEDEAVEGFAEY